MPKPSLSAIRSLSRRSALATLGVSLAAGWSIATPAASSASTKQISMIQDGLRLQSDPVGTMAQFRALGATTVRVVVLWYYLAPHAASRRAPAHFKATDPNAYAASAWAPYDAIVQAAKQDGMTVDFTIAGGAPVWADGSGIPPGGKDPHYAWKPSAKLYGQFVEAVGKRYDGNFTPQGASSALPAVHFWSIWNEPNFGEDLGPQAIRGSTVSFAPMLYRNLVSTGYRALGQTGHGHDTILIGEFAARGINGRPSPSAPQGYPGNYSQTKPLQFIRTLYCVGPDYRQLTGGAARDVGCPTTRAAYRSFRNQNPGLFNASGVGDHPYPDNMSPTQDGRSDPNFATFPDLGNLEKTFDRVNRIYGSYKRYAIYNDEYGYITSPPARRHYVSPATAAYYLNWAEYLSWRSPRIVSYMQYLLGDPGSGTGPFRGFASGLYTNRGAPKPTLAAYMLPLYMPRTSLGNGASAEVWGKVRPAHFIGLDSHHTQSVAIQLQAGGRGAFTTVKTVTSNGYFDVRVRFPSSGNVRLLYTYPSADVFRPIRATGATIASRLVAITVH